MSGRLWIDLTEKCAATVAKKDRKSAAAMAQLTQQATELRRTLLLVCTVCKKRRNRVYDGNNLLTHLVCTHRYYYIDIYRRTAPTHAGFHPERTRGGFDALYQKFGRHGATIVCKGCLGSSGPYQMEKSWQSSHSGTSFVFESRGDTGKCAGTNK